MNFIKKIVDKNFDDSVHAQLTRFGKGEYKGRAPISLTKTSKTKLKSGFEFVNDFVLFASDFDVKFNGFIWSKNEIEGLSGAKKAGKWVYEVENLESSKIKEIFDEVYYLLLNCDGEEIKLKIKKKLPKPGKSEKKIDDKFCQIELDKKYFDKAKEEFFWDVGNCKKAKATHTFLIEDIGVPEDLKKSDDFALVREKSKRVGKVIRNSEIDGKEIKKEYEFSA